MSPASTPYTSRIATTSLSLIACMLVAAACDDDPTEPVDTTEWQAELAGAGAYADVEGLAAVTSTATSFDAAVEIAGAEADAVFAWRVAEGTCAEPGDRVGGADRYGALEVAEDGTAEAEADVTAALDDEGDYIVSVIDESGAEDAVVACAALEIEA